MANHSKNATCMYATRTHPALAAGCPRNHGPIVVSSLSFMFPGFRTPLSVSTVREYNTSLTGNIIPFDVHIRFQSGIIFPSRVVYCFWPHYNIFMPLVPRPLSVRSPVPLPAPPRFNGTGKPSKRHSSPQSKFSECKRDYCSRPSLSL